MSLLWACVLAALSLPPQLDEARFRRESAATGPVLASGWPESDVRWAIEALPQALARCEARFGRSLGRPFTTVLVPDRFELARVVERIAHGPPADRSALGVAIPSASTLVLRWDHVQGAESLRETLYHEVAHLVIHNDPAASIPRWLDEGAAQWASKDALPRDALAYLSFLARIDGLYPLATLALRFPEAHELSSVAYQQSFLFVAFIETKSSPRGVAEVLDLCARGKSASAALEEVTHTSMAQLERDFRGYVSSRSTLAEVLRSVISIWTIMGLLALGAVIRYVYSRGRRLRALGPEDGQGSASEEAVDPDAHPAEDGAHEARRSAEP